MSVKFYKFDECEKGFKSRSGRSNHVRVIHRGQLPYGCNLCPEEFTNTASGQAHFKG